eukprot:3922672-Prymnesium_polylepis.1
MAVGSRLLEEAGERLAQVDRDDRRGCLHRAQTCARRHGRRRACGRGGGGLELWRGSGQFWTVWRGGRAGSGSGSRAGSGSGSRGGSRAACVRPAVGLALLPGLCGRRKGRLKGRLWIRLWIRLWERLRARARGRALRSRTEVVARRGDGHAHQVGVVVHRAHDGRHDRREGLRLARHLVQLRAVEEVDTAVGLQREVIVLARAVDALEGLLVQPAGARARSSVCRGGE